MPQSQEHLKGLNNAQREAVLATKGPLLVLAGAGAGKTRVITHRILQLVKEGVAPDEILAITFTNKAAGEMRTRTLELLAKNNDINRPAFAPHRPPFVSTFHSLGLLIIKENFKALGLKRRPSIYDRADSMRLIKEALKQIGADGELEPRAALGTISRHKGEGVTAGQYAEAAQTGRERTLAAIWLSYERALAADSALDFDDLLARSEKFLRENAEARAAYQRRWKYVHIDEYQDTNKIQAKLASHLVGPEQNICAVGDVDQTIYGWRGAEISNIMTFEKKFPGAKTILLEQNYRSTKNILAAANDIISKNKYRPEKNLFTANADGEKLSLYQAYDETDEANFIVRIIGQLVEDGASPQDFTVLYRANFQSRAIEEALLNSEISYQVVGTRFFERKEIKDVLSFVRAALVGGDVDIARVANIPPRGIGKVTLLKMLAGRGAELTGAVREKVAAFRTLLAKIKDASSLLTPSELIKFVVVESGMEALYKEDKLEGAERLENIRELVSLASRYDALPKEEALDALLESAALASDQDEIKDEKNAVRLMTVHASKGLEFPYVFITGLEEGLFPYEREDDTSEANQEEERRLMYVALTRAEKKVFLSYASYRTVFGSKTGTAPSQFLSDISNDLVEWESPMRLGKTIYLD
ncbi:MAG TPA: UvrD-helicase domain-containing protein [Candidatus Paceibacterota bacterium]|nr:UvrD-helicase domain-containing protein [Candidatus Paceibacterota bacterium]